MVRRSPRFVFSAPLGVIPALAILALTAVSNLYAQESIGQKLESPSIAGWQYLADDPTYQSPFGRPVAAQQDDELQDLKKALVKAKQQAESAQEQAEKARAQAEKAMKETVQARRESEVMRQEAEEARRHAESAMKQAQQQAMEQAQQARQQAMQARQQVMEKAMKQSRQSQQQAMERAREQAQKAQQEAREQAEKLQSEALQRQREIRNRFSDNHAQQDSQKRIVNEIRTKEKRLIDLERRLNDLEQRKSKPRQSEQPSGKETNQRALDQNSRALRMAVKQTLEERDRSNEMVKKMQQERLRSLDKQHQLRRQVEELQSALATERELRKALEAKLATLMEKRRPDQARRRRPTNDEILAAKEKQLARLEEKLEAAIRMSKRQKNRKVQTDKRIPSIEPKSGENNRSKRKWNFERSKRSSKKDGE